MSRFKQSSGRLGNAPLGNFSVGESDLSSTRRTGEEGGSHRNARQLTATFGEGSSIAAVTTLSVGECSIVTAEGHPTLLPQWELIVTSAEYSCSRTPVPSSSHREKQQAGLMVAPYEVGEPVRSFVRVPTKDRAAKALCWDLSRASSLVAASAPVRQHLLRAQPQPAQLQDSAGSSSKSSKEQLQAQPKPVEPQPQPVKPQALSQPVGPQAQSQPVEPQAQSQPVEPQAQSQPVEPQAQSQPVEPQAQSQPVEPEAQATTPGPLPAASQQQVAVTPSESKRSREEEQEGEESIPQPVLKSARIAGFTDSSSPAQPPQCLDKEVQSLRQQCQLLQQQNNNLQRRLNLFHGLFQDKQRLKSFVRHMDTLVK
ncbi:hypothetical protein O3P69_014394 [Scylla paramamosain]|uniref:Uncharacterized protein n=1 Tax=Scylla paramamosain TaxID=85552 RepID=A0AAW0TBV4_SCYPA